MLRNRSRAVTGKQALMADQASQSSSSSSSSYTIKPLQNSLFGSPRFKLFSSTIDQHHSVISPTSVLDSKPYFSLQNSLKPISKNTPKNKRISIKNPIGLALIEEKNDSNKPTKSVVFSAKLRVQIPPVAPVEGGGEMLMMTVKEMEVCEEYTCVKRHGPNAKVTHIFDNFVVKSFVDYGNYYSTADVMKKTMTEKAKKKKSNNDFFSFCYTCKNDLDLTNDIYIYRGEKAFCSHECRNQEMLLDEEEEQDSS